MPSKVERMRDTLLLAIEQVRTGVMAPDKAKAMAALAHQVNASLDVELRVLIAAKTTNAAALLCAQAPDEPGARVTSQGVVEQSGGVLRHTIRG